MKKYRKQLDSKSILYYYNRYNLQIVCLLLLQEIIFCLILIVKMQYLQISCVIFDMTCYHIFRIIVAV